MDQQTNHQSRTPRFKLTSKAIASEPSEQKQHFYFGLIKNNFCLFDIEKNSIVHESDKIHQKRIGCMRNKNNILITGGHDHTVKLFDTRSWSLIHRFQKIPSSFNSIDKSQHILTAATDSNIVFWDLRTMKKRSQFHESFASEISYLRFEDQVTTNLYACSIDGMISMFDLAQPNQEDALNWCNKIMECPQRFATGINGRVLVRTSDQLLYKIIDGQQTGKISPNNAQNPKHIAYCQFKPNSNFQVYQYFTWSPEQRVFEQWRGSFMDKTNQQKCVGYLFDTEMHETLDIINTQKGKCIGVFTDDNGCLYIDKFVQQREKSRKKVSPVQFGNAEKKIAWNFKTNSKQTSKSSQNKVNKNGYLLQKPISSFSKHKNFKPY